MSWCQFGTFWGCVFTFFVGLDSLSLKTTDCEGRVGGTCVMSCYESGLTSGVEVCWYRGRGTNGVLLFCIKEHGSSRRIHRITYGFYPRLYPKMQRLTHTDLNATIHVTSLEAEDAGVYSCYFTGVPLNGTVELTVLPSTSRPTVAPVTPSPPRPRVGKASASRLMSIVTTDCTGRAGGTCVMSCYGSGIPVAWGACWYRGPTDSGTLLFCITGSSSSQRTYNSHPSYYPRVYPDIDRINHTDINTTIHFKTVRDTDAGDYSCYFQGAPLNGTVKLTVIPPTPRPTTARPTPARPSATDGDRSSDGSSTSEDGEDREGFSSTYGPIPHDGDDGGAAKSRSSSQSAPVIIVVVLVVLVAFGLAVWWWLRRRNGRPTSRDFRLLRYFRS